MVDFQDTKGKMENHIQDLKKQLVETTAELENYQNEKLFLTEELIEVTKELEDRTKLNQEKVEKYSKELTMVQTVNNTKQARVFTLQNIKILARVNILR